MLLIYPDSQQLIINHMKRASNEEELHTLSGRTDLWRGIISWDITTLLIGGGLGTSVPMHNYSKSKSNFNFSFRKRPRLGVGNAHDSIIEVLASTGILGLLSWSSLMVVIFFRLWAHYIKFGKYLKNEDKNFLLFASVLFTMCLIRTLTNTNFVILDIAFFLLPAFVLFADGLREENIYFSKA